MGTVVHGYDCQRMLSCLETLKQQRTHNCHRSARLLRTIVDICLNKWEVISLSIFQSVTFFCDREGDHLETRICKDLFQAVPLLRNI